MSTADAVESPATAARPASSNGWASLAWVVIGCSLLGGSGVVRLMQERRHQVDRSYREPCPFDLKQLPAKLGEWKLVKGSEKPLDPLTMRITGGSDHLIRSYANDLTGVTLMVLILFGPSEILPHVPAVCYPSSGFTQGDSEATRVVDYPTGKDASGRPIEGHAVFQSASYFKPAGRAVLREAVYHSFRLDGEWSPLIGSGRKFLRRSPGFFKVQIQRQVADGETLDKGDPIEQFLQALIPEIEARIKPSPALARN